MLRTHKEYCYTTTFTGSPYLVNAFKLWKFKKIMIHWVIWEPGLRITLNSNLSFINIFCKLLILRCSIEKILLLKLFKSREEFLEVKYCESLRLKTLKKFSSGYWLSLFNIFSKSKVLKATDSKFEICLPSVGVYLGTIS